jgi:hypothetical protein
MKYMQLKRLIVPSQHGFVPNKACVTNLLETLDFITDALKNGHSVDLVLLDFAKAFDKVSHAKLVQKLKAYGIDAILVRWIESFLTGRKQRVLIGGQQLRMGVCDQFGSARFGAWSPPIHHFYK